MNTCNNYILNYIDSWSFSKQLNDIRGLNSKDTSKYFENFAKECLQKPNGIQLFARFCEVLPENLIKQAYGENQFNSLKSTSEKKIALYQNISLKTQAEQPSWIWAQVMRVSRFALIFFETIIFTFGISEAFSYNDYTWGNGEALLKPWHNISTFVLVLSTFFWQESAKKVALVASVSIAAISLIYPYIHPYPARFKHGKNLTQAFAKGEFSSPTGRAADVQEIANAIRTKKKAMLIGQTGVGKTETIKAMVAAFQNDAQYQDLKHLNVVYVSAPDLAINPWCERIFFLINDIGRHNKNTIIVFDEIHTFCQEKNHIIGERLKLLLDDEKFGIVFAIGITTDVEYKRDIADPNPAFKRRFKTIPIAPISQEQTEAILLNRLRKNAPHMICEPDALNYIIEQCQKNSSQPLHSSAMNILDECILKTENPFPKEEYKTLADLKLKEESEIAKTYVGSVNDYPTAIDLSEKISAAEQAIKVKERKISKFENTRKRYVEAKDQMLKSAKKCMLMHHLLVPLQDEYVSKGDKLKIPTHLSKALVDEVIANQQNMDQRNENLIQSGSKTAIAAQTASA